MSKPTLYAIPADAKEKLDAIKAPDAELIDPLAGGVGSPRYKLGLLPAVYEQFALDQCYMWGGNMELYAGSFAVCYSMQLHRSVRVRINHTDSNSTTPLVHYVVLIAPSGSGKTGVQQCVLKPTIERSAALLNTQVAKAKAEGREPGKMQHNYTTHATLERVLAQQQLNDGEPFVICPPEVSALLDGMTNHIKSGYRQLADFLNAAFDAGALTSLKQNAAESDSTAEQIYTNVFTCTTPARLGQWEHLETAQRDGLLGRFDMVYGTPNHNYQRDSSRHVSGAYEAWHDSLLQLRGLRDGVLVMDPMAFVRWVKWVSKKKADASAFEALSPGVSAWLLKAEKRAMRLAATWELLKYIDKQSSVRVEDVGKYGRQTIITISEASMAAAIRFHDAFLFNHQVYFHDHLMIGNEHSSNAVHLFFRLLANNMSQISREDFWGAKCLPSRLRSQDEWKRARFAAYVLSHGWLMPSPTAQYRDQSKGAVGASRFDVVAGFHERFASHREAATDYWTKMNEWKDESDW